MARLYRSLLVLAILFLIILGLNTSNQGINSLTMEARKPVIGLQTQGNNISIFALGETHSYGKQEIKADIMLALQKVKTAARVTLDYLLRIVRIFKVLVFA